MIGMNPGAYAIAAALLFLFATECRRGGNSKEMSAIESAYKSGVLTKDEYAAKLAAIRTRKTQLAALDHFRDVGLLSTDVERSGGI